LLDLNNFLAPAPASERRSSGSVAPRSSAIQSATTAARPRRVLSASTRCCGVISAIRPL
jgi:hypothetical protein